MKPDPSKIDKLLNMEEEELKEVIHRAALSFGMSERRARLLSSHAKDLQKRLSKMSPSDMEALASKLGEERLEQLLSNL